MSEQAGLLQAICENPDDDTPRLVYADWLDDQGDTEQAEFIRTGIALARVPEHDALAIRHARATRDRNLAPFRQPLPPPLPDGVRCGSYRRGFPWKLEVFDFPAFWREAPRLFEQAPIQALDIDARNLADITPLTEAPWLAQIVRLEFSLGRFGEKTIDRLISSPYTGRLTDLVFEFDGIRSDGLRRLLTSPLAGQLRSLSLHSNFFGEYGRSFGEAFEIASAMPNLESLDLSGNRVGLDALRPLVERGLTPSLRDLNLSGNQLDVSNFLLSGLGSLPCLETLRLAKTVPGPEGVAAIVSGANASNFRALYLASNRLGPFAIRRLTTSSALSGLRVLDLSDNPLNDSSAVALAGSPHLTGLLALNLRRTSIGTAGARALLDSPTLSNLIHLDLHGNAFTPAVVEEIRSRFGRFSATDPQWVRTRKPRGKKK